MQAPQKDENIDIVRSAMRAVEAAVDLDNPEPEQIDPDAMDDGTSIVVGLVHDLERRLEEQKGYHEETVTVIRDTERLRVQYELTCRTLTMAIEEARKGLGAMGNKAPKKAAVAPACYGPTKGAEE